MEDLTYAEMSKIQALQQKRTLAFVNHFVTTNVQFLNNFMKNCEQKLMSFERKLEKVNAATVLLEARLSSIPELTNTTPQNPEVIEIVTTTSEQPAGGANIAVGGTAIPAPPAPVEASEETIEAPQSEDKTDSPARPEYNRFIKMVQVGVPIQAVKLKVSLEGLDPDVFEEILGK